MKFWSLKLCLLTALMTAFGTNIASAHTCAVVYQGDYFDGESLAISEDEQVVSLGQYYLDDVGQSQYSRGSWDNRVSSIVVSPNCELEVFQYQNFGIDYETGERIGDRHVYKNKSDCDDRFFQLDYLNNKISSLSCRCR